MIRLFVLMLAVIAMAGCATGRNGSERSDQPLEMHFVKLAPSTLDGQPINWVVVKVTNRSGEPIGDTTTAIHNSATNRRLYGPAVNSSWNTAPDEIGASEKKLLQPGETAFRNVALRNDYRKGDSVTVTITPVGREDSPSTTSFTCPADSPPQFGSK